jgi:hypothetical protein
VWRKPNAGMILGIPPLAQPTVPTLVLTQCELFSDERRDSGGHFAAPITDGEHHNRYSRSLKVTRSLCEGDQRRTDDPGSAAGPCLV